MIPQLKTQRLQRPGRGAFEEPARPHSQTMMPRWQALSVKRKPRLPRQRTADHLARRNHGGSFRAEAYRFAKFDKMFRFKFVALDKSAHIGSQQARLLKRKLSSARERRDDIFIEGDIPKREYILVTTNLQRWFDHNQPATIFLGFELFN